ncbi:MAG TPA: hypothetical protein VFX92_11720 [Candidatus Krumholzibacteria bacterium]|nr:hypothetical protein [Candidatus Krumholzibacteria bacterium]
MKCDHSDGTMAGTCAVCGDPVCSECYTPIFSSMICSNHEGLDDEGEWELVALYQSAGPVEGVRFLLDDQGLQSLAVENDEGMMEVYVPIVEKDEVWMALEGGEAGDEMTHCEDCRVFYPRDVRECPICGKESEQS